MAPPVDENTTCAPCASAAARTATVPSTFTSASSVGSRDRDAHGRLGGEVEDELGLDGVEDVARVADVRDVQPRALGHVVGLARREVVEDVDVVAARDERLRHVRADESRAAGHDRPHRAVS